MHALIECFTHVPEARAVVFLTRDEGRLARQ